MAVAVTVELGCGRVAGALTLDGVDERITPRDLVRRPGEAPRRRPAAGRGG